MNQLQILMKRRNTLNLFRSSNRKPNGLYWHSGETDEHIQMKLEICKYLKRTGKEFLTEAIFVDGSGRCDIVNLDEGIGYEVYSTEGELSLLKKQELYSIEIILVDAKQKFNEKLIC
jgi:hypothetical protein